MGAPVLLRQQPVLTVWVDNAISTSNASAITRVMFAAINGSIEGGYEHGPVMGFNTTSSLACDVDISLKDSTVCTYSDSRLCTNATTVFLSLNNLHNGNVTLESTVPMRRMVTSRTWILLIPPALVLGSIVIVVVLCAVMSQSANVLHVRLGTTSEVVISSQMKDINAVVQEARSTSLGGIVMISKLKVRYGFVAEGYDGLARKENALAFARHKVGDLRVDST